MKSRLRIGLDELEKRLETVRSEIKTANALCEKKRQEEKRLKKSIENAEKRYSLVRFYEKYEGKYWKFSYRLMEYRVTAIIFIKEVKFDTSFTNIMEGACVQVERDNHGAFIKCHMAEQKEFRISLPLEDGGAAFCQDFYGKEQSRLEPSTKKEFFAMAMEGATAFTVDHQKIEPSKKGLLR